MVKLFGEHEHLQHWVVFQDTAHELFTELPSCNSYLEEQYETCFSSFVSSYSFFKK